MLRPTRRLAPPSMKKQNESCQGMSVMEPPRKECFQATISVLTPLHAGQGELLHRNVDYLIHQGHLLVFRLSGLEQEFGAEALANQPAFRLAALGSGEKLAGLAAYRLALPPRTQMPARYRRTSAMPSSSPTSPAASCGRHSPSRCAGSRARRDRTLVPKRTNRLRQQRREQPTRALHRRSRPPAAGGNVAGAGHTPIRSGRSP